MISETKLINCLHLAHIVCFSSLHSAMNGQQFLFSNLHTDVVFPGAGITLDSFRYPEGLPQIHLPKSFLLAARGIESRFGKLLIEDKMLAVVVFSMPFILKINGLIDVAETDTVKVVNVVMNNMENYLPSYVIKQDKEM